jgi:hypothetical protein
MRYYAHKSLEEQRKAKKDSENAAPTQLRFEAKTS